jgi:sterol desaturase/sphingolipid hydroxylase (fatty acid hydroxylase superfamily)
MSNWITGNEEYVRTGIFLGAFAVMAIWEVVAARRELTASKGARWLGNLTLIVLDAFIVRLLFPAAAVGMALTADRLSWGLFNNLSLPIWLTVLLSVVLLDLAIYLQHVMFHVIPALWRLHLVHHADVDIDVTTGIRFHPIEIVLSMVIKFGVIAILGAPVLGVLLFEIILNGLAMFNHGNVRIPLRIDKYLRLIFVTPDMHRVHHSVIEMEYNTNFGFNLSCWDRLMGTYLAQPSKGHDGMTIGLPHFRETKWHSLPRLLLMPFDKRAAVGAGWGTRRPPSSEPERD